MPAKPIRFSNHARKRMDLRGAQSLKFQMPFEKKSGSLLCKTKSKSVKNLNLVSHHR